MCMDVRKICECGQQNVQFHMRDNILLPEVIVRLYCPNCQGPKHFDSASMLSDNGWIVEYDMVLAKTTTLQKMMLDVETVSPEFIFDQGYACWQEMYPGEQDEIKEEKTKIVSLLKTDQKQYLQTIQNWNVRRIEELKKKGWRKAQAA